MILAKTTNIQTGSQGDEFHICYACYWDMESDLVFTAPEIYLCIVEEDVEGTCSECGETDAAILA